MVDMDRGYFSVPSFWNLKQKDDPLRLPDTPVGHVPTKLDSVAQEWAFDDGSYWENRKATQVIGEETEKWQRMDRDHPPTQRDHLLLLPSRVFGFVFRTRKWACLQLGNGPDGARMLRKRKPRTIPWDDLELPDGHKNLVQSLIASSMEDTPIRNLQFDLIRAKGVIILLHGVPGVGKTSTAECTAEANNKPLFPITCGDLGTSPREVETRLQEAFQLAQLWNCVLLLDEADVFLAQRSEHDIQRNALVSVFLRLLEYYQGILFLTSNRVGVFDEAFKSRIHMALYHPPLDWDQTGRIWATHLAKLRSSGLFEFDHNEIIRYAKIHFNSQTEPGSHFGPVWNGRQIRNAFQSAVALAAYNHRGTDKIRLTTDEFEKVSKVSNQFNDYLWSIQGRTDSEKASTWGVRDDAWNQTGATRNNHGVQNLNRAMPTRNVPKDVWVMGQQGLSAAAAGPSYQISPPQQPLHPHPIMYGQGITGHPLQHGQQMTMPAQSTGFPDGYAQLGHQGQPQYSPLYQQPHLANYPLAGQAQPTNMPYR
ncbi:P-loop containing nucleoside triphosphate hydrolase protein [Rhypophila decipiens]|uniref:P-loop containing nucleoside triphosphate hydrolase protein n=1 Tax=Rhypophila decipiens TaxID=261697 RepID=A0AAN6YDF9_9PEZI|nr:P-loop containing nucleoside triphosphate hydrolase protein [Rhypophila decipiens]